MPASLAAIHLDLVMHINSNRMGLKVCDKEFNAIVSQALLFSWTRDLFDRVIVANAGLNDDILISKDPNVLAHYPHARW